MDLLSFNYSIIKNLDKNLAKKIVSIEKKFAKLTFKNEEIALIKIKSEFAEKNIPPKQHQGSQTGKTVINSATALALEESCYPFSYCLKILELYPIKNEDFSYWNEHINLFSQLERNGFSEEYANKLKIFFIENFNFNEDLKEFISISMLRNPGINILLILLHLDHLISRKWTFKSICLNQALKFKFKKEKPYYPSKTFTDLLVFILEINAKFEANKRQKVDILKKIPEIRNFDQWLDPETDGQQVKKFRTLLKKMRENQRQCYLDEVYKFLGLPYGEFHNDEIYEQVCYENYLFLKNELPEEKWFDSINAISGLWLIYYWQNFYYEHIQKTASVSNLALSEEFILLWGAFLNQYPSEGKHIWPSELISQDC